MTCQHCGEAAQPGDVFCQHCGTRLAPTARTCRVCAASNQPDSRFCTTCGTALDQEALATATMQLAQAPPAEPPSPGTATPTPAAPPAQPEPGAVAVIAPAPAAGGFTLSNPVSLIGAVVAVVGSLIPWFDVFGTTTNSFDIAAPYLLDHQTTASDTVTVGLLVAILGGAAAVACLVPRFTQRAPALRALGAALFAVAALFGYQVVRTADAVGVSVADIVGIGPIVTAVGAVAVLTGR